MLDQPQADPKQFDMVARKLWLLRSEYPFRHALRPGFWDSVIHANIAPDDRIDVICMGDTPATHATLVVDEVGREVGDRVKVSVLQKFERQSDGD